MFDCSKEHFVRYSDEELIARIREDLQERLASTFTQDMRGDGMYGGNGFAVTIDEQHVSTAWIHGVEYPREDTLVGGIITAQATVGEERVKFKIEINEFVTGGYMFINLVDSFEPYPA